METGQRLKEQAAPLFLNFDGTPGPIVVTGVSIRHKGHSCMCGVL
jgi:hypothetical protein